MTVHGDDFIVAGCGDDLDWLSHKLNEKLELVQKARLGPGYDSEATELNRCVAYNDSGLTWEADPRHAELAVAELGLESARPQTSPGGAKPSRPLDHEELEPDGQKACHSVSARLAYLAADRLVIAFACKECSRAVGKATRADLTRLKRSGRYILHTPRAVWEFPLQTEESIVTIDGLSDADAAGFTKTRRSTSGGCLRVGQHILAIWSSTQKVVSLSGAEAIKLVNTTRVGTRGSRANLERCSSSTRAGSPQRERRHQSHGDEVLLASAEREEPGAQDREDPCHRRRIWMANVGDV